MKYLKPYLVLLLLLLLSNNVYAISDTDIISCWDLDETSGVRYDYFGSNDLTDNNTVGYASGVQGNGADFIRANSEYLSLSSISSISYANDKDLSISYWFRPDDAVAGDHISKWANPSSSYKQEYLSRATGGTFYFGASQQATAVSYSSIVAGNWYHVVITMDSSGNVGKYINNANYSTGSAGTVQGLSDSEFRIGQNTGANYYDGTIDVVAVFGRILTSDDVSDLYNSGSGIPCSQIGAVSGTSTTATSTVNMTDTNFLLGVIIFILSFLLLGLLFSIIKRK